MMKLLKALFLLSCCFLSYLTYKIYQGKEDHMATESLDLEIPSIENQEMREEEELHLYLKGQDSIEKVTASEADRALLKKVLARRGPASIKTRQREFLGKEFPMEELRFKNSIDADWKEKLGEDLLRFQAPSTKANVISEKSFIQTDGKKNARFVEQVLITFLMSSGEQKSYNALVDSESGQIIKTWNKGIAENKQSIHIPN